MKITLISGNFKAVITGEIATGNVNIGSEKEPNLVPAQEVVNDCGVTYIGQRDGWTGFYKPRLTKGQERSDLEYSDDLAVEVNSSLTETLSPYVEIDSIEVEQHFPSEGASEMKRATALVDSFYGTPKQAAWVSMLGASEEASRDDLIKLAHEQKLGITPPRAKKAPKA